jgi:7-carboxy-7-deazaguanine synthase
MNSKTIRIAEIFTSIQGESSFAGIPCFFIRLAGCNLNCSYCDTEFAKSAENCKERDIDEIVSAALESGVRLAEITGGEPLLQKHTHELCKKLLKNGFTVLLETNGSLRTSQVPEEVIKIIDCKCPSSGESESMDLANFAEAGPNDEIKFVISDSKDYDFAKRIINDFSLTEKVSEVIMSPVSPGLLPAKLADWILKDKLEGRMQLQLHKIIWGNDTQGR